MVNCTNKSKVLKLYFFSFLLYFIFIYMFNVCLCIFCFTIAHWLLIVAAIQTQA